MWSQTNSCPCKEKLVCFFIPLSVNIIQKNECAQLLSPSTDVSDRTMTHYVQSMNCHKQMLRTLSVLKMC